MVNRPTNYSNFPFASCLKCKQPIAPYTREMQIALNSWGSCLPCKVSINEKIDQWNHTYFPGQQRR